MAPSKPRDAREFVRVSVTLPDDPKLIDTSDVPRCGWLFTVSLIYARKQRTDGVVRPEIVIRDAGVPKRLAAELVRVGMWHEPGHDCPRCVQPPARHVVVHDFLEHQQSREESEAARAKAKAAAEARWGARTDAQSNASSSAQSNASSIGGDEAVSVKSAKNSAKKRSENGRRNTPVDNRESAGHAADATSESDARSIAQSNAEVEKSKRTTYLLTLISRLAAPSDARTSQPPAEVIDAWQELAGPDVDLDAEAAAYLRRFGDRPADDERGAWLGWLTKARQRADRDAAATAPPSRPTPVPSTPHCPIHPEHPTGSKTCPACTREKTPAPNLRALIAEEAS